ACSGLEGLDEGFKETVKRMREDFLYWYPVDLRSSGKDLVANHLLFFLFHHIAIFPPDLWPRAIAVNGYVSLEGKKMSKSKGPLLTMKRAVLENGADVTRLYILYASEYDSDADWRRKDVESLSQHLRRFYELIRENYKDDGEKDPKSTLTLLDRWLLSRFQRIVKETTDAMEELQTRRAVNAAFFEIMSDVRWYLRRGGKRLSLIIDDWLKLLSPFIPHICEELWHLRHDDFVSLQKYPEYDEGKVDAEAEAAEEYVKELISDIKEILKFVKAKKVYVAIAEPWKAEVLNLAVKAGNFKDAMKEIMKDERFRKMGKEVSNFVKKAIKDGGDFKILNEEKVIQENIEFISKETGVELELNQDIPEKKRKLAMPGKPALYAVS
ncbi:leucine--tRNA ligase, partial [Archaeoglobales archaeon]